MGRGVVARVLDTARGGVRYRLYGMNVLASFLHTAFHRPDTRIYRCVDGAVWVLILTSIALLGIIALTPEGSSWNLALTRIDRAILVIFALEIFLRVASFRPPALRVFDTLPIASRFRIHVLARLRFVVRPIVLVDIVAVLALFPQLRGLRVLRLLRLVPARRVFRYRNPLAIVPRIFEENSLLFALAFSALGAATLVGGTAIYAAEAGVNANVETLQDGIWWALVTITTVGFGDITPVTFMGRAIGGVMMVAGMFTLAMFAGIVGSSLVRGVLSIREEQFRMSNYANHVVVCGYDQSTHLLLDALAGELSLSETRVVLMDDHERPRELPPDFLWVRGNPTKESELDKVRLTHAAAVIVSGERDVPPHVADARTILTTFTVRNHLDGRQDEVRRRRAPLYVVAEILDSENVAHARAAGADEVIETQRIGYSMIAHAVGYHGSATTMSRVLLSGSHNVYVGTVPGGPRGPQPFGELLRELKLSERGGLVVGLRTPSGRELINPPRSHVVEPDDIHLIYLAEEPLLDPPR